MSRRQRQDGLRAHPTAVSAYRPFGTPRCLRLPLVYLLAASHGPERPPDPLVDPVADEMHRAVERQQIRPVRVPTPDRYGGVVEAIHLKKQSGMVELGVKTVLTNVRVHVWAQCQNLPK